MRAISEFRTSWRPGVPPGGTGETPALHPNYRKWNQSPITVASSARLNITLSRCSAAVSAAGLWRQHRGDVHLLVDGSEGQAGELLCDPAPASPG